MEEIYKQLYRKSQFITTNPQYRYDLVSEGILAFLEKPKELQDTLHKQNKVVEYIFVIMKTQFNSANSDFHKKYRENQILNYKYDGDNYLDIPDMIDDPHNVEEISLIMSAINAVCNKFEKQLILDRHIEGKTYQEIAQKHGWSVLNITNKIKEINNKIKQYTYGNL